jgi:hypothetical protein
MFGRQQLIRYLRQVVDDPGESRERVIVALYGLAALSEPVLLEVQALSNGDLSTREQLYVALAAAELGDRATAERLYADLLARSGERRGAGMRLNVGADEDDILEATSLAAGLGALLGDDYAPLLFDYTTTNYTRDILVQLEQISYLVNALPNLSAAPVRVAYTLGGQRSEKALERGDSLALHLSPDELRALNATAVEGSVGVSTSHLTAIDPQALEPDPAVSIERTYEGQSDAGVTVQDGQLVRITINWSLTGDAVDGCYQVSDLLPSGLRPVTRLHAQGIRQAGVYTPYDVQGQRVSFCVWKGSENRPLVYYARVIGKGSYMAEPAVIQAQAAAESIALTSPAPVEIR